MRKLPFLAALFLLPASAYALTPDLSRLDDLPLHVVPEAITAKAIEQTQEHKGAGPAIFAVTATLPVGLDGGVWDQIDARTDRWRARVYSAGALSLLMEFGEFHLPAGAELWIYDVNGEAVQGPYTSSNHSAESSLWTALVPGEMAVIELQTPIGTRDRVQLALARLGHGYKNARDLGDSGACNINTACSLGNDWRNEIRATVKLQIPYGNSVGVCSGTLINNLRQDNRPYILTADHCGIGESGSPASGVVVYWSFQNSSCNGIENASDTQNQTGTILRADDRQTDFTLLELSNPPSSAFNVYFAGWDSSGAGGLTGISIHHPSGDAKKISEFTRPLRRSTVQIEDGGPDIPAWQVTQWQQGTTEQGSSGSGLWNQDHQIVGTLSGGSAACSGTVDNNRPDFYARLDTQWLAGSASNRQLKAWLDPNNTGLRSVDGKNSASDTTPNAFRFTAQTNVPTNSLRKSNTITVSGINAASPISVIGGGTYSIGCTATFTSAVGTINNGQTVCVRRTSSPKANTAVDTTLSIGGIKGVFAVTTGAKDTAPNAFSFKAQTNVPINSPRKSNTITISGINAASPISVSSGGAYSIGCTATFTTAVGAINNGQTVCVRRTSSSSANTTTNTTLSIGGVKGVFAVTTLSADTTPDAFSFTAQNFLPTNSLRVSNTITVRGIDAASPISVSSGGAYSIGCTSTFMSAASTINNGQTVCVRRTSSSSSYTTVDTTLTIGGINGVFTVTTGGSTSGGGGGSSCCRVCSTGKPCGDSCISRSYTCHVGPGCAC